MSAEALLEELAARAGQYAGRGVDDVGRVFLAELEIAALVGGRSVSYRYRAQALESSEVTHDESGLVGTSIEGSLALMVSSSHYRHLFPRPLVALEAFDPAGGGGKTLVFGYNDPNDTTSFRDQFRLSLLSDGRVGHAWAWGLAGGSFAGRSSVVLEDVTRMHDERPVFIRHYRALMEQDDSHYPGSDELLSIGAPIGRLLGLSRIGVHVETIPTGRRTSFPHAELTEEEMVFVLSGHPEVWIDGVVYRLRPGDAVGFKPGTGIAHTFINNAPEPARLVVLGEHRRPDNRLWYPLNPERRSQMGEERWWAPAKTELGPHDGLPDARRKS